MPPRAQRRNTAYLNRPISRFGPLDCGLDNQAPRTTPDLRFISGARSSRASDLLKPVRPTWFTASGGAPRDRRNQSLAVSSLALYAQ